MKQPVKNNKTATPKKHKKRLRKPNGKLERSHPKFGTSKLEEYFASEFLDKLGVKYQWQWEAKEIGRFYDFAIFVRDSMILVEVDGGYYHSDPRIVDEEKLSPMQKKNRRVDEYKNKWALLHSIPIMRFWEKDIRENPSQVMKELKERLYIVDTESEKTSIKNKRHKNKLLK